MEKELFLSSLVRLFEEKRFPFALQKRADGSGRERAAKQREQDGEDELDPQVAEQTQRE